MPPEPPSADVTALLERARAGDREAMDLAYPLVMAELRRIAGAHVRGQASGGTLGTTALVDEVYLRLLRRDAPWESRAQFFNLASRAMRTILIDHARSRKAQKRGGALRRVPLDDAVGWFEENAIDLIALDEAIQDLEKIDERKRLLVDLRFFAGQSHQRVAEMLGVSLATVEREWALTRAWLHVRMGGSGPGP
jgi:RNA polymerase sigma-70 factor (ECF subfamily)